MNKSEIDDVWPPPPKVSLSPDEEQRVLEQERLQVQVEKRLSAARKFLVYSLLLSPVICLPVVFYHGIQANRIGSRGQANGILIFASIYAAIVIVVLALVLFGSINAHRP